MAGTPFPTINEKLLSTQQAHVYVLMAAEKSPFLEEGTILTAKS